MTVEKSQFQCAGLNRHEAEEEEALRVRTSDPLGLESCAATARDPAKRRQRYPRLNSPPSIVLQWHGTIVIMEACKLSSRRRVAWTGCAVLPAPGIVG